MGVYEAIKDAVKVAQKADNIELVQTLLDVQKMALDMQEKQQGLNARIASLESTNAKLQAQMQLQDSVTFDNKNGVYRKEGDSRAFCPVCYERDRQLSTTRFEAGSHVPNYYCSVCKTTTYPGGYQS